MGILNIILIPACQVSHLYQISLETTLTGKNNLDSILKLDPMMRVIEILK